MGRLLRLFCLVGVGLAIATGVGCASARAPAKSSRAAANLWIDANGGSCTRRPTPQAYVDARACGSLQAAADAGSTGDVILIQPGRYPGQKLAGSKRLIFAAAKPARPSFGQIITSASNFTLRHVLIENRDPPPGQTICSYFDFTLFTCGANQTYDDVTIDALNKGSGDPARRGGLQVDSASKNLVFKNGEIRGVADTKGFQGGADGMLLANNYWHDIRLTPAGGAAGVHNECAYITGGNHQTWRRNRFINCPVMAMFFANYIGGPPFSDVTVENNLFTHPLNERGAWHDGSAFVIPGGAGGQNQVNGWIVRYNTFEVPPDFGRTPGTGDDNGSARFYGNLGSDGACGVPEWTYRYNVGATCGGVGEVPVRNSTNDSSHPNQAPFFVNAPKGDFHLRSGSQPINRGDPDTYPARDRDGKNRLVGSAPDAGAYEFSGRSATTGILAIGGRIDRRLSSGVRSFERQNPASLALALGDSTATWKSAFAWLHGAGIRVSGASSHYVRRLRGVELVVLGSHGITPAETNWLKRTLAHKTALVRIVVVRDPPVVCGSGASTAVRRWGPLFQRYGVRLVISGGGAGGIGTCAGADATHNVTGATRGFVYVTVDVGGVVVRAVDVSGKTIARARVG